MDFKVKALYFGVNSEALQLTDPFPTSGTARPGQITTNRTILSRRVPGFPHLYGTEVRLLLLLESLLLYHLPQVEISLKLALFFDSLYDALLVFKFSGFAVFLEHIVIIKFRHLVRVLEEVVFQVHEFVLSHCPSLVGVNLLAGGKPIGSVAMPGPDGRTHDANYNDRPNDSEKHITVIIRT